MLPACPPPQPCPLLCGFLPIQGSPAWPPSCPRSSSWLPLPTLPLPAGMYQALVLDLSPLCLPGVHTCCSGFILQSSMPCLGWTWGSVVVKTELTLSRTSAPNSIETAPFSEDVCSPSAVLEPDGTTEPHPREHRVRPEQKRLWKSRSVGPRGSGARRAERCKEPMGAA